ncbi:MAG: hypothetical protein HY659_12215 [Rhizobiales bacterium]|nr:hypothetical protein [Hyphomicrobiales bacterium]
MTEDNVLISIVCIVWAALALLYATVPMFNMPGSALVWGAGAAIFAALAAIIAVVERAGASRNA